MTTEPTDPGADPVESLVAVYLRAREDGDHAALDRLCADHVELAAALRARVAAIGRTGLLDPAGRAPAVTGFVVHERLGAGGMGEVWRAEQQGALRRSVALKVIQRGYAGSDQVLARFESERQAMALMSHPGIAQVFEAGTTADGAPFFAMELIHGAPITQFCDERELTVRERVRLFAEVCEAVHHAHQRGVLHRDLKPANILVAEVEGRPMPKVIDFGLAKALEQQLAQQTLATELGQVLGTPEYMSPEQAEMSDAGVDIRADVYSLGVVLYELCTGAMPFDAARYRQEGLFALLRAICAIEPPRASQRVETMGGVVEAVAELRGCTPVQLARQLRGDLDWILLRALAKDRRERYESALDLARDLRSHLEGLPVRAGPPTAGYRLRKFVRRHRVAVAFSALVLVVLVVGLITSTTFFLAASRNLAHFDYLANVEVAVELNRRARDELWPMHPDRVDAMRDWMDEASAVLARRDEILEVLAGVRADNAARGAAAGSDYHGVVLEQELGRLAAELEDMLGLVADVGSRIDWALDLQRRSIDARRADWDRAIASIGDPAQCPRYEGLQLEPQLGLVPLRRNEQGLWEFALLHPGLQPPAADPDPAAASHWRVTPDTSVVLVLLPRGMFDVGAQVVSPTERNYDPLSYAIERRNRTNDLYRAVLYPFFVSKYELTQAQWAAASGGDNPSLFTKDYAAARRLDESIRLGPTNPVENVSWLDCVACARRLGLALPTETQWEFFGRACTTTPWWTGAGVEDIADGANLRDNTCVDSGYLYDPEPSLTDGFVLHAPVGSFPPNPFGVHDTIGNVHEWTLEAPTSYDDTAPRLGDGMREHDASRTQRIARGGGFDSRAVMARSSFRLTLDQNANGTVGVRFVRPVSGYVDVRGRSACK